MPRTRGWWGTDAGSSWPNGVRVAIPDWLSRSNSKALAVALPGIADYPACHVYPQSGNNQILLGHTEEATGLTDLLYQLPELSSAEQVRYIARDPAHERDHGQRAIAPHFAPASKLLGTALPRLRTTD